MVKRAREIENSPQTPCNDANWHVIEHNVAQLIHWDREGDRYGETGMLLTSLLLSLHKGAGTMI